jgi:uncharacterized protein YaaW (UPF0174 family)
MVLFGNFVAFGVVAFGLVWLSRMVIATEYPVMIPAKYIKLISTIRLVSTETLMLFSL